jgi:glycolate oxidase subunit GlcD
VSPPGTAEELRRRLGAEVVLPDVPARYLSDATESRALRGTADAVALPRSTAEVADVLRACCDLGVPVVPRGGGTGFSGGCVPDGGVVLGLERMSRVVSFEPLLWRMRVDAGVTTSTVRRLARESGLLFPPDPGAGEQSQLGGNVATNAGGPHAFKYGVTRAWVTGLEVVVPPGETIRLGGDTRKDVAGLDLLGLLVGSEGTLGVVTSVWLRLVPAPEAALPVIALYPDAEAGCAAVERLLGYGLAVSALEFLDAATMELAGGGLPVDAPAGPAFALIAEADGTEAAAAALRDEVEDCCREDALLVHSPRSAADVAALWRWREGVSLAVEAVRGGKVSEDVDVPVERLGELLAAMEAIGSRHDLRTCNWGHAGDGNVHATFLVDPGDPAELERAEHAAGDLFAAALELGGTISGEHGIGLVKLPHRERQFSPAERALQERVKRAFDPGWLLNPGKKLA